MAWFSALANAVSLVNAFLSVVSALVSVTANQIAFFLPTTPACQLPLAQTNVSVTIVEHQLKIISNLRNRSVSYTQGVFKVQSNIHLLRLSWVTN